VEKATQKPSRIAQNRPALAETEINKTEKQVIPPEIPGKTTATIDHDNLPKRNLTRKRAVGSRDQATTTLDPQHGLRGVRLRGQHRKITSPQCLQSRSSDATLVLL
jgi:hypothetical protein